MKECWPTVPIWPEGDCPAELQIGSTYHPCLGPLHHKDPHNVWIGDEMKLWAVEDGPGDAHRERAKA